MTYLDLALADAALEHVALEADLVSALSEAVTYRGMLLDTLERWHADKERLRHAQQRIRQMVGVENWSPDAEA